MLRSFLNPIIEPFFSLIPDGFSLHRVFYFDIGWHLFTFARKVSTRSENVKTVIAMEKLAGGCDIKRHRRDKCHAVPTWRLKMGPPWTSSASSPKATPSVEFTIKRSASSALIAPDC